MIVNWNIYFSCFVILFTLRNFTELFIKPKKAYNYKISSRSLISSIIFVLSYMISGIATGFFLLICNRVNVYLYILGIFIFIVGYFGRIFALKKIGNNYSQFIEPVDGILLVNSGVYSIIRHPLYMFFGLEMVGFIFIKFNYISLFMLIIDFINTFYRIKKEEYLLTNIFKEKFINYKKRTKKIIPFVY